MRTHSRLTGGVRLLCALWLIGSAVWALTDPARAQAVMGIPMGALLAIAGLSFTVGAFLLTGFMSRVCGLVLVGLGVWQTASFGFSVPPIVLAVLGAYFALRGGGAWAMDIYVQKMQDRVRQKALNS
ncbi:MAG: hypothetical protein JOZ81_32255 [Chloroflexi bacterium]|nr:hypothetical protein [Chloroflexota bacterium]